MRECAMSERKWATYAARRTRVDLVSKVRQLNVGIICLLPNECFFTSDVGNVYSSYIGVRCFANGG